MRPLHIVALLSTTALVAPAAAQIKPQQQPQQQIQQQQAQPGETAQLNAAACDRLVTLLQQHQQQGVQLGQLANVTLAQAQQWQQQQNIEACADANHRWRTTQEQMGSQIVVQQQAPQVRFDQAEARRAIEIQSSQLG